MATLLAFNEVERSLGIKGGSFLVPKVAATEPEAAEAALGGRELIVDLQTHCVDRSGSWASWADGKRWMNILTVGASLGEWISLTAYIRSP